MVGGLFLGGSAFLEVAEFVEDIPYWLQTKLLTDYKPLSPVILDTLSQL